MKIYLITPILLNSIKNQLYFLILLFFFIIEQLYTF
ncbi:putative membrane protein, partial [Chlamydia psittaci 02DC14]